MTLHFTSGTNTAANASAYQVTGGEWASGTIQWSNKPAADVLLQSNISHNNVTGYVFSCLTAVQHWYDGDTTGQNENYGIMLRYYNESTADYNAVYSADHSDATKRPSITISYDPHKITIKEGDTCNLSVSRATGNVIWTSSNTVVASVSSTGVVTGNKAGCATITASVNGTVVKEYVVYVKILDGIFYIRNKSTGYYLSTKYKDFSSGTRLVQSEKMTPKQDGLWQIWKISYMVDGCYSLRPMHKPNMGIEYTDALELQDIGTAYSVAAIGEDALWSISYCNGGYEIRNYGQPNCSICAVNSQCDSNVTVTSPSSAPIFRWLVEPVTVSTDLILYTLDTERVTSAPRRGAAPGQSRTLEDINLTFAVSSVVTIGQIVYWESSNESVATVDRFSGTVTGVSAGETQIQGTAWVNGTAYSETYTLVVSEIPISGSELPYEPGIWNSNPVKENTNCYSYAFNNQVFWMSPGFHSVGLIPQGYISKTTIVPFIEADAEQLGFDFYPISKYECCPSGSYKVALVVAPGKDYHWYRQNPDGTWSHKIGDGEMSNLDASGEIIVDPNVADRYYNTDQYFVNYTDFVGYYCVTPLSYYATAQTVESISLVSRGESIQISETIEAPSDCSTDVPIDVGMTLEEVNAVLGEPQRRLAMELYMVEYLLDYDGKLIVQYIEIDEQYTVYSYCVEVGA